jgi:hypothetical protein
MASLCNQWLVVGRIWPFCDRAVHVDLARCGSSRKNGQDCPALSVTNPSQGSGKLRVDIGFAIAENWG